MRSINPPPQVKEETNSMGVDFVIAKDDIIINRDEKILVTGANGFIGTKVVGKLLRFGFTNLCCFVRPTGNMINLNQVLNLYRNYDIKVLKGNLLSVEDCKNAAKNVSVIIHLAAGIEKTFPGSFMNSVVTTRNLLDAVLEEQTLKRFLNVSSFAVYSPLKLKRNAILDETCKLEKHPEQRDPYCFGKLKQEEIVKEYHEKYNIPYVIVRPGAVYGPGKNAITGRVGIDTFGIYLHMGGNNTIPFTYVDNCAEAMILASIRKGVDGEVFNIVDDDLPQSSGFLRLYKHRVESLGAISINRTLSYLLCLLWEKYSAWSEGQLPPVFNRRRWASEWKGHQYSNVKLKKGLGWRPTVSTQEGMERFFRYAIQARIK
jgi:nucleoside-diphosphate-sugar epimerase